MIKTNKKKDFTKIIDDNSHGENKIERDIFKEVPNINEFRKRSSMFAISAIVLMIIFTLFASALSSALNDTTRPTIVSTWPANNQTNISRNDEIKVVFSEEMNVETINSKTFKMIQRTTPLDQDFDFQTINATEINLTITYSNKTATFRPHYTPNQEFGNVFTMTLTGGIQDLAGNSIARNYVWSFTTGGDKYNTGPTTSQLNQTSNKTNVVSSNSTNSTNSSVVAPIIVSATQTNPITTTATTQNSNNNFPWIWIISAAVLLLLLIIIFSMRNQPQDNNSVKSTKRTETSQSYTTEGSSKMTTSGEVHSVGEIEGIGPKYSKSLQAIGIKNTEQLLQADAIMIARKTGAPLSSVKSWQNMAELASVKNIGPQYAELLERSGIHSINQLKNSEASKLLNAVEKKQDSLKINIQGNTLGQATIQNWINSAKDHRRIND